MDSYSKTKFQNNAEQVYQLVSTITYSVTLSTSVKSSMVFKTTDLLPPKTHMAYSFCFIISYSLVSHTNQVKTLSLFVFESNFCIQQT